MTGAKKDWPAVQGESRARRSANFTESAAVYDLLHQDKDYAGEAEFVHELIRRHSARLGAPSRLLDLACGTGKHARELAKLGYAVEGADASAEMIDIARKGADATAGGIPFHVESFQTCNRIGGQFEVVVALYASVTYLTAPRDFTLMLENVRGLLAPDGLFIFDFWNGQAVENGYSSGRTVSAASSSLTVRRTSRTTIDPSRRSAELRFLFEITEQSGESCSFEEVHELRYFFPDEMTRMLDDAGFDVVAIHPVMKPSDSLGPDDWYAAFVARRRPS